MSELLEKIRSRGHWTVRIIPATAEVRMDRLGDLEEAVRSCAVRLRGWDFPHFDNHTAPLRGGGYVEQGIDWSGFVEFWRAYRSGQFFSFFGIYSDWEGYAAGITGQEHGSSRRLSVEDTILRLAEIYLFASRWASKLHFQGAVGIKCELAGLAGRVLHLQPRRRGFLRNMTSQEDSWEFEQQYELEKLLLTPRDLAAVPAIQLLEIFGLDLSESTVRDIQSELRT